MNFKRKMRLYIGDIAFCLLLALMLVILSFLLSPNGYSNKKVRIISGGKEFAVIDLSKNVTVKVNGVTVTVCDGKAVISDSDCSDKVCMAMNGVDKNGGGAVCIPNKVVLEPVRNVENTDTIAG